MACALFGRAAHLANWLLAPALQIAFMCVGYEELTHLLQGGSELRRIHLALIDHALELADELNAATSAYVGHHHAGLDQAHFSTQAADLRVVVEATAKGSSDELVVAPFECAELGSGVVYIHDGAIDGGEQASSELASGTGSAGGDGDLAQARRRDNTSRHSSTSMNRDCMSLATRLRRRCNDDDWSRRFASYYFTLSHLGSRLNWCSLTWRCRHIG